MGKVAASNFALNRQIRSQNCPIVTTVDNLNSITLRKAIDEDIPFLARMHRESLLWDTLKTKDERECFGEEVLFKKFVSGWGRAGDKACIAQYKELKIGAACYRLWTDDNHFLGFVNSETPQVIIAIISDFRSQGVGRMLLNEIVNDAKNEGYKALSLCVDTRNFAKDLYQSVGFYMLAQHDFWLTMNLQL